GLHGANPHAEICFQIVACADEIAILYVRHDDPPPRAQSLGTGGAGSRLYPLPALGGFFAESPAAVQRQLSVPSTARIVDLDAGEISVQSRNRRIYDLFVQRFGSLSTYQ